MTNSNNILLDILKIQFAIENRCIDHHKIGYCLVFCENYDEYISKLTALEFKVQANSIFAKYSDKEPELYQVEDDVRIDLLRGGSLFARNQADKFMYLVDNLLKSDVPSDENREIICLLNNYIETLGHLKSKNFLFLNFRILFQTFMSLMVKYKEIYFNDGDSALQNPVETVYWKYFSHRLDIFHLPNVEVSNLEELGKILYDIKGWYEIYDPFRSFERFDTLIHEKRIFLNNVFQGDSKYFNDFKQIDFKYETKGVIGEAFVVLKKATFQYGREVIMGDENSLKQTQLFQNCNFAALNNSGVLSINTQTFNNNLAKLNATGHEDIASAFNHITNAIIENQKNQSISNELCNELLEQIEELVHQANLPSEKRSKVGVLKTILSGIATTMSAAGGLAEVWTAWGTKISAFFGF